MSESNQYNIAATMISIPRQYSFIKFDYTDLPEEYHARYPFSPKHRYIFLGEIPNMGGHCIVMDDAGKMYTGFHIENFVELTDDELAEFRPVGFSPK